MDVKKLEELLQGNRIDLRMLNKQQKIFIDELQKSGKIDTRPLDLMEAEQNHAAEKVAKEKERFADPIRDMTADLLNRDKVAMYTDIGVLMAQMLWDRKRLAGAILNPKKFIGEIAKIKSSFKNPLLNKTVTGLKQVKKMVSPFGMANSNMAVRYALMGSVGYTGGGIAYDLADEIARDQMDLKRKVGDKTYKEMMGKNQLLRSLDDFRIALTFNGGAEMLGPLAASSAYGLRKMFGLETPYARSIAEIAKNNNFKASYVMLADPNTWGGKFLKTVNRVFGQLPIIGGPAKEVQLGAIKHFNQQSQRIFELEPGMHLATAAAASEDAAEALLKNYEKFANLNKVNYRRFADQAIAMGDPRVIDLTSVKQYMNSVERSAFAPPEVKAAFVDPMRQTDPWGIFYNTYKALVASGRPISITEYTALRTLLNQTTDMLSKNKEGVMMYNGLQKALERDFAKMDLSPAREVSLRYNVQTGELLEQGGNVVAQEVKSTVGKTGLSQASKKELKENIEFAYDFYANNIKTYNSITARKLSAFDENALSFKQLQNFKGIGKFERDQMLAKISKNIFQNKTNLSFNAITDLQKLVNADVYKISPIRDIQGNTTFKTDFVSKGSKEGNETLRRLWGAHVGQAYQMSFRPIDKNPMGDWISAYLSKEGAKAADGMAYKTLDEMKMPNGLDARNLNGGNMFFDPNLFRKMILNNEAAATQMKVIFGPQKANKLLKSYDDLLAYMDAVKSYTVPEASTFLARRLVLSGPNVAVGAGAYGMGFFPMALMLYLGRRANKILSNPDAAFAINKQFENFLKEPQKYFGLSSASRLGLAKLSNVLLGNEYDTDDFKFDTSDASMQRIFQILEADKADIDKLSNLNMDSKMEEQLFPKLNEKEYLASLDNLPPPEMLFDQIGGLPANLEEEQLMASAVNAMPSNAPITKNTLPRQQGLRIPGPGVQPVDYGSLFPFDPLGNTISARRQTRGQG